MEFLHRNETFDVIRNSTCALRHLTFYYAALALLHLADSDIRYSCSARARNVSFARALTQFSIGFQLVSLRRHFPLFFALSGPSAIVLIKWCRLYAELSICLSLPVSTDTRDSGETAWNSRHVHRVALARWHAFKILVDAYRESQGTWRRNAKRQENDVVFAIRRSKLAKTRNNTSSEHNKLIWPFK